MKILRERSREYKGKTYFKHKVNIPENIIKEAGFELGEELDVEVKDGEVKLKKK